MQITPVGVASNIFAMMTLRYIYMFINGNEIPIISGNKQAAIVLFVMGLMMSMLAGVRDSNTVDFETMSPLVLNSLMALGFMAVGVLIVILTGFNIPVIGDYVMAYKALAGIIGVKLLIMRGYLLALAFQG
jgi:hypothetical protein